MVARRLFVAIIATCISFTFAAVIDTNSHEQTKVQSRTWDQGIAMAKAFVAQMTLEEKCNMTSGVRGPCVGTVLQVPRLNFSGLCFQDSPSGVGDHVLSSTAFAAGIQIAATWDRDLFYRRGVAIGKEFQGKGVHFALGPMMNIDRNARHGRNWEGFGSDPYLSGENSFYYVQGVQDQGVVATAKHYICNEQETNRFHSSPGSIGKLGQSNSQGYSANLDDKTIHEIYLWPFAASVAAGVGSIMCSYNQVNGTQACQNDKTLNGLLKEELGFQGNVMSDWGATKTGVESVLGGLDVDMPGGDGFMGYALLQAVKSGSITEGRINDMITRILAPYFLLGQDQGYPSLDLDRDATGDNYKVNRQVGTSGIILLKNTKNVLPFNVINDTFFAVYGSAAGQSDEGFGSGGQSEHPGVLYQGGGSGYVQPTYGIDPLTSLLFKARDSHLKIQYITNQNDYNAIDNSFKMRGFSNAKCLVFISAYSSEGSDRHDLHALNDGDKLVQTVASHCAKTIVIVNSVSQLNLEAWIDLPNVVGVVWSGLPGSEYGPAIVDVLFGDYNPGGKLVFTLAKNDSDYGTDISPTYSSNYTEGVFLDYRHFDQNKIVPRYSFGYGLSYTTFSFSNLNILKARNGEHTASSQYQQRRMRSYTNIGASRLYEPAYETTFTITNTGKVDGSEVPQLYLGFPAEAAEPPKVLRGFERVYLTAGQSQQVTLTLTQKDISYWNVVNQKWTIAPGTYTVWISTSANNADVKLQNTFNV
jgi:beta-glucosidase-like glycosyl hydrolase